MEFEKEGKDDWTDEQILMALDFANDAFRHGKKIGKQEKADEIKSALDLWHDTFV